MQLAMQEDQTSAERPLALETLDGVLACDITMLSANGSVAGHRRGPTVPGMQSVRAGSSSSRSEASGLQIPVAMPR